MIVQCFAHDIQRRLSACPDLKRFCALMEQHGSAARMRDMVFFRIRKKFCFFINRIEKEGILRNQ